jgi:hypothetical protein
LLPGVGSVPVSLTVAEFVIVVPAAVPAFTATTIVNAVLVVPAAIAALAVHVIVPVPPTAGKVPQVQPVAAVAETNVVFAGVVCVRVAPLAAVVPLFVTVSVYVMFLPAPTGFGAAACVIDRSAALTVTEAVAVLFAGVGSVVVELIVTVSLKVPFGAVPVTSTTTENVAVLPLAIFAVRVRVMAPVPPTPGDPRFHVPVPPVLAAETKVVLAGVLVVTTGALAVFAPLLITVTV